MEELFELIEARFDQLLPEGLNESVSQEMINEAFNSAPYPTTVEQKGSQVDFFFDDEDDSYRIQFFGAAGSWGRDVDTVYIGKQRGRVYADNIDKIKNPNKVIATFLSVFTKFIVDNPRGINKSGFAVNLSGKAAKRFAPVLKKVLARTMKGKVEVVKGFQPDAKREFVWVMRTGKKPEDVFSGKKITDAFDFSSVTGKSTNKPSSTGVVPAKATKNDNKKINKLEDGGSFKVTGDKTVLSLPQFTLSSFKNTKERTTAEAIVSKALGEGWGVSIVKGIGDDYQVVMSYKDNLKDDFKALLANFTKWAASNQRFKGVLKRVNSLVGSGGVVKSSTATIDSDNKGKWFGQYVVTITPGGRVIEKPSDGTGAAKATKPKVDDNPLAMYGFPNLKGKFTPPKDYTLFDVTEDFEYEVKLRRLLEKTLGGDFKVSMATSNNRIDLSIFNEEITHKNAKALEDLSKQFMFGNEKFKSIVDWVKSQSSTFDASAHFYVGKRREPTFRIILVGIGLKQKPIVKTEETKAPKFSDTVRATASPTAKAVPISSMKSNDLYDWAKEYNEKATTRKSLNVLDADFSFSNLGGDYYFTIEPVRRRQASKADAEKMAKTAAVKKVVRDLTKKFGAPRNVFGTIRDIDPTRPEKGDFAYVVIDYGNGQGIIQAEDPRAKKPDGEEATIMRIEVDVNNSKATEYDTRKRVRVVNSIERSTNKRNGVMVGSVHQSKYSGQHFLSNGVLFEKGKAYLVIDGARSSITKPKFLKFLQALAEKYPDSIDVDTVKSKMY